MAGVWWLRWVIVAIAALIGVVLISNHHFLIGVLLLAMAVARAVLLVAIRRRRAGMRAGRPGRYGPRW